MGFGRVSIPQSHRIAHHAFEDRIVALAGIRALLEQAALAGLCADRARARGAGAPAADRTRL
eukprot:COSAG02_NODE_715_length_18086_cov_109.753433_7_plen_62_part_00